MPCPPLGRREREEREMLLPEGKSIDCNLAKSFNIINPVSMKRFMA
jgi:hypothetical protein